MSQGNDFANYTAASSSGPGGSDEVWFVAVASDDIKQMTIDQLDEAFRLGVITGETPVWTEGMEAWAPLSKVADLDAESGSDTGSEAMATASVPAPAAHGGHAAAGHGAAGHGFGGHDAVAGNTGSFGVASGAPFGSVTLQSVQHSVAPGPSSVAPVTASYAPSANLGHSSVPVSIGGDDELPPLQRRGGVRAGRWVLAGAAALIAVGVLAYNYSSSSVASEEAAAASAPALAARPYEGADGVDRGTAAPSPSGEEEAAAAPSEPVAEAEGSASAVAAAAGAAAAATTAKAALVASSDDDAEEAPPSAKKTTEKTSLRSNFSKSLSKKSSGRSSKVKPRRSASRASTKSRAKSKKSSVVRSQSAFDPLNDSLP